MKQKILFLVKPLLAAVSCFVIILVSTSPDMATPILPYILGSSARDSTLLETAYSQLPLKSEVNVGQTDAQVKFLSPNNSVSLYLTPTEAVLAAITHKEKPLGATPFPPEDYRLGSSKAAKQQPRVKEITSVILHREWSSSQHALKPQISPNQSPGLLRRQLRLANRQLQVIGLKPLLAQANYSKFQPDEVHPQLRTVRVAYTLGIRPFASTRHTSLNRKPLDFLGNAPKHWHTNIPTELWKTSALNGRFSGTVRRFRRFDRDIHFGYNLLDQFPNPKPLRGCLRRHNFLCSLSVTN